MGDEPTYASSYHVPLGMSDFRYGHSFACSCKTLMPAESHTSTTTSLGGVWPGSIAFFITVPSGAVNPSKCNSEDCVGAISASVTVPGTWPLAAMWPGPYQNIGTCWM